jgi:hypothetical protein
VIVYTLPTDGKAWTNYLEPAAEAIEAIEAEGWQLEHISYANGSAIYALFRRR